MKRQSKAEEALERQRKLISAQRDEVVKAKEHLDIKIQTLNDMYHSLGDEISRLKDARLNASKRVHGVET